MMKEKRKILIYYIDDNCCFIVYLIFVCFIVLIVKINVYTKLFKKKIILIRMNVNVTKIGNGIVSVIGYAFWCW